MTKEDDLNERGWQVGNVYDDFDRLEQAIAWADAPIYKKLMERKQVLDMHAQQRRPIHPLVSAPLALAFFLASLPTLTMTAVLVGLHAKQHPLASFVTNLTDIHYWSIVVALPLWMLWSYNRSKPPQPPLPPEMERLAEQGLLEMPSARYLKDEYGWEDPDTSCSDIVLCLLEQCMSCVKGATYLGILRLLLRNKSMGRFFVFGCAVSQLLNRMGALASFHQFPELICKLQWKKQPRPMERYTVRLQSLVRCMSFFLSIGVASDLAKVIRFQPFGPWRLSLSSVGSFLKTDVTQVGQALGSVASAFRPRNVVAYLALILSLVGPIWHLVALKRIVSCDYGHDLSYAYEQDMEAILADPVEKQRRYRWRWAWRWREPERMTEVISRSGPIFTDWLFFKGTVEQKERQKNLQDFHASLDEKVQEVVYKLGFGDLNTNITAEMEELAVKHEKDYESGDYGDPLGVAVWKVFGIGLCYDFDHFSDLEEGEEPSLWRLRARAAKSAIRRAQQIYDAQAAQAELDSIADPEKRNQRAEEMKREAEYEMKYLVESLKRLIPFNFIRNKDPRIKFDIKLIKSTLPKELRKIRKYKKVSDHEQWIIDVDEDEDEDEEEKYAPEVVALLEQYGPKSTKPAKLTVNASNEFVPPAKGSDVDEGTVASDTGDEFVDEWLKRKYKLGDNDDEDDEDGTKTVLA